MIAAIWPWLTKFGAPILLGVVACFASYQHGRTAQREDWLRKQLAEVSAGVDDAAAEIRAAGKREAERAAADAAFQTALLGDREGFYEAIEKLPRRIGECRLAPADAERLRLAAEAANRFAAGGVRGAGDGTRSQD